MRRLRLRDRSRAHVLSRSSARDGEPNAGQVPRAHEPSSQALELTGSAPAPILVLCGPTGTGKSKLALRVAERLGGEVVGCDALQVYRGLDAATAKPTRADRERVPHWLIDVADPRRDYSVADYVRDADAAIAGIVARGHVPVIAGGTGMYLRGLLKGLVVAPPRDEALRLRLRSLLARFGAPRMHRLLAGLDAGSAARIGVADAQRIVRALELSIPGEDTWSARLAREGTWSRPAERYRAVKFGLDLERDALAERLAARVDAFLAAGLAGEVERLLAEGVPATANAFRGIGYREVLRARTEGREPDGMRDAIVVATRQYAKRQRTWFRREPGLVWLDAGRGIDALVSPVLDAWNASRARGGAPSAC
jgi:tRNA dimethylallyltransferase